MKKQLLAACLALTLPGLGCDEPGPRPQAKPVTSTPVPRVEPPRQAPSTAPPRATLPFPDGGLGAGAFAHVDGLPLEHDDGRSVDHLGRVTLLRQQGDLEGALVEARRALHDDPTDEAALAQLDGLCKLTGNKKLRVAALERMAQLQPDDSMPLVQKARVLISLGDHDGAAEAGAQALTRDPNNPETYQALGRAHLSKGELSAAIAMFEKVISLDPDHGYALNNLGFAYLRANRNEEAVEVLTRASDLLPHTAYVFNNLGVALERTERVDEAKAAYAQASFLSPKYLKAQLNSARLAALSLTPSEEEGGDAQE